MFCKLDKFTKEELASIVANSYSYREVLKKTGYTTFNGRNKETLKRRMKRYGISADHFDAHVTPSQERNAENVFCKNSTASQATLRRWYVNGKYREYVCDCCGNGGEWNGKKLALQLDHIDGDNHNNTLDNLRWLCPNCHSQTPTYCGKSKK